MEFGIIPYEEHKWTVYVHENKINGKRYVGITGRKPEERWRKNGTAYGKNNNTTKSKFWNAIQKYGWDNFYHIIVLSGLTQKEASLLECLFIKTLDSRDSGYNLSYGGMGGSFGRIISDETRQKLSFNSRRENLSAETLRKMSEVHKAENLSAETRKKLSESGKARTTGFIKGSKHTEETKIKMREKAKKKPVICLNSLEIFDHCAIPADIIGINKKAITNCCRGITKSSGKHISTGETLYWIYEEKYKLLTNEEKQELYDQYFTGHFLLPQNKKEECA